MRDTTKMIAIGPATPMFAKSQLQVYSSSGEGLMLLAVRADLFSGHLMGLFSILSVGPSQNYSIWLDWR